MPQRWQIALNREGPGRSWIGTFTDTGSINQAAKQVGMSYKSAWSKIRSTEARFGSKIVITDRATGSRLTAEGLALLKRYQQLKRRCLVADDAIFNKIFGKNTAE